MKHLINKADSRLSKTKLLNCLEFLKLNLTQEGYDVLIKFLEGSSNGGWNRWSKLMELASFFGYSKYSKTKPHYLTKGDLSSYTNKDLYQLINGKDLVEKFGKLYLLKDVS
jgi:hypothetical protein